MSLIFITALVAPALQGFWRCGKFFPRDGIVVQAKDFTEAQIERLIGEPMLRVSEPTEEQLKAHNMTISEDGTSSRLPTAISEAIKSLSAEDFQQDGKPRLEALNELLKEEFGKVNATDRDQAWETLQANGFEAPASA